MTPRLNPLIAKRPCRARAARVAALGIVCTASLFAVPNGRAEPVPVSREDRFIWDQANSQMSSAQIPADFLAASETYQRLVDSGVRNGPLFYNLGTALLKAGEYDRAVRELLRAERYMGSNPEIRRNLAIAMTHEDKETPVTLPWYRFPLFWHYGLACSARAAIAAAAFSLFWIVLALGRFKSGAGRELAVLALLVFVLFGSSVLTSLHEESLDNFRPHAVAAPVTEQTGDVSP